MNKNGFIHVYTGNGKGKTTAAVGLAVRAKSHGLSVCFISFHKNNKRWGSGEFKTLKKIGIDVFNFAHDTIIFNKNLKKEEIRKQCLKGMKKIENIFYENRYNLVILDEINISFCEKYLCENELIYLIKTRPLEMELVLTGRNAPEKIIDLADLVTEMKEIKHYFSKGIAARKGIDR